MYAHLNGDQFVVSGGGRYVIHEGKAYCRQKRWQRAAKEVWAFFADAGRGLGVYCQVETVYGRPEAAGRAGRAVWER